MIRPRGPLRPLADGEPVWSEDGRLLSRHYADAYFGHADALAESRYVFIDGNGLRERLRDPEVARPFVVGELGFGTGTNFLLTWQAFERIAPPPARLHYISIDAHPLRHAMLVRALGRHDELAAPARSLLEAYPPPIAGLHRRSFAGGRVLLDLYWADVADALAELARNARGTVDAWYLDGFAPARNPAMWDESVLRDVACASRDGASVATFSAAGSLRRALATVGFDVSRRPGFGRKRESIRARLTARPARQAPAETPWDLGDPAPGVGQRRALVLGAGLAGCHAAAALARRGWQVEVLEAEGIAARASGNAQGLLFHRFSHQRSPLADFSLQAVAYAHQLYCGLFAAGALRRGRDGDLSGCLQTPPPRGDFAALRTALADLPELARTLSPHAASERLGTTVDAECLWQANSGWLAPGAVCRALLAHPAIRVETDCGPLALERGTPSAGAAEQWIARDRSGACRGSAPVAIVAAGSLCRTLAVTAALPLRIARGQTTLLPASAALPLKTSLCHRGYIAPAADGYHAIGATFTPGDADTTLRRDDQQRNLDELARALPDWQAYLASLDPARLEGRAELRCVSPDYLPLAGPVPDGDAFRRRYAALGRDARRIVPQPGSYQPGLYVTTAHGSRGLSYAALAAELLASRICGEAPPLTTELCRAIAPARFLIRAIVRGEPV